MPSSKSRLSSLVQFGSFFSIGVVGGVLGPLIPSIREELQIDYALAGLIFSAQSFGSLFVLLAGGWLLHTIGKKPLIFAGGIFFAVGLVAAGLSGSYGILLAANMAMGVGMALLDIGISTLCLELHPEGKGKALNLLHFFFGVGAVAGPIVALLALQSSGGWRYAIALIAVIPCLLTIVLFWVKVPPTPHATAGTRFAVYRQPLLWLTGLSLLIYCGVEWGVGAWFPSYWKAMPETAGVDPAWAVALFWFTFAIGRFTLGKLADRMGFARFLLLTMVVTIALIVIWLLFPYPILTMIIVLLFGFVIAGQYPTLVALAAQPFPESSGQVASLLSVFAGMGTLVLLPGMGAAADRFGISALPWMELIAVCAMTGVSLLCFTAARRLKNKSAAGKAKGKATDPAA